jgi:peptidoglycan/LPS O-acetylase OafA/YrhL
MEGAQAKRLAEVNGMRGLGALAVFSNHVLGMVPWIDSAVRRGAVYLPLTLVYGRGAAYFFFVLSGLVLCYPHPLSRPQLPEWRGFLIRRILRLYPTYWLALLVSLLLRGWVFNRAGMVGLSSHVQAVWTRPVDGTALLRHLFLISPHMASDAVDPVIWSLVLEMKIALAFPAILLLVQATRSWRVAAGLLALVAALSFSLIFCSSLLLFLTGAYAAKFVLPHRDWFRSRSRGTKAAMLAAALVLFRVHAAVGLRVPQCPDALLMVPAAVGCVLLLMLFLTCGPLQRLANCAPVRVAGDLSYSFYLLHLPLLYALTSIVYPRTGSLLLCAALGLLLALAASWASYRWIEMPSHALGKRWARRLGRPPRGTAHAGQVPSQSIFAES